MKKSIIIITVFILASCEPSREELEGSTAIDVSEINKPSSVRKAVIPNGISVQVIDSCEYIVAKYYTYSGSVSLSIIHKQNCKFHPTKKK